LVNLAIENTISLPETSEFARYIREQVISGAVLTETCDEYTL